MKKFLYAVLAIALTAPAYGAAQNPSSSATASTNEIQTLTQELQALRAEYEQRLQVLEQRLQAAEAATQTAAAPPSTGPATAASGNAFNPTMSLILSGGYTNTSQDPESYHIAGFQLPSDAEVGPGPRGFNLAESELDLSANIDPWLRGSAAIALHPDNAVSVEEAFIQTTSLGEGFTVKAGRFLSGIGYLNSQHAHTWDFVDSPLAYQALLGGQYGNDGVQLSWLAPTDQYLELSGELGSGSSFPGGNNSHNGAGMNSLALHTGGDVGDSHSWRAGISTLFAKTNEQELASLDTDGNPLSNSFTGNTRVWLLDGVWKWAPHGNATRTNFKLQGEYLRSTRDGVLTYDMTGMNLANAYDVTQSGWYLQGVYQFIRHWRVGVRTERLNTGTPDFGSNSNLLALTGDSPRKNTVMIDFSPSEFSRVRLQFARDYSRGDVADNQAFLQYQMSLGAHGAHTY